MKLFMDNVPTLAIQAPIIRKIPEMLSPTAVSTLMNTDLVTKIAGESEEKVRDREETLQRLKKLEMGAQICKEYVLRPSSGKLAKETLCLAQDTDHPSHSKFRRIEQCSCRSGFCQEDVGEENQVHSWVET
jgi:hypothetical protein